MKYFIITDIHSYYEPMLEALKKKGFESSNPQHSVIICGDLFDRGPDAAKCFEFALGLWEKNRLHYIRGNHEDLLLRCVNALVHRNPIVQAHYSNGTIDTICQFTGYNRWDILIEEYNPAVISAAMDPVMQLIYDASKNYIRLRNFVFVHGWIPTIGLSNGQPAYNDDWENGNWEQARWANGMQMWRSRELRPTGIVVVCGHWHTSWGWHNIDGTTPEFPDKGSSLCEKAFAPFKKKGLVALDSCVAYSGFCNCVVLDDKDWRMMM